jgi:hypothetical protein
METNQSLTPVQTELPFDSAPEDAITEQEINDVGDQPERKRVTLGDVAKIKHHLTDGVYIKAYAVPKGIRLYSKAFPDRHVAILAAGSVLLTDGETKIRFVAPAHFEFPAFRRVEVLTLENSAWYCVHATDETDLDALSKKF